MYRVEGSIAIGTRSTTGFEKIRPEIANLLEWSKNYPTQRKVWVECGLDIFNCMA